MPLKSTSRSGLRRRTASFSVCQISWSKYTSKTTLKCSLIRRLSLSHLSISSKRWLQWLMQMPWSTRIKICANACSTFAIICRSLVMINVRKMALTQRHRPLEARNHLPCKCNGRTQPTNSRRGLRSRVSYDRLASKARARVAYLRRWAPQQMLIRMYRHAPSASKFPATSKETKAEFSLVSLLIL